MRLSVKPGSNPSFPHLNLFLLTFLFLMAVTFYRPAGRAAGEFRACRWSKVSVRRGEEQPACVCGLTAGKKEKGSVFECAV